MDSVHLLKNPSGGEEVYSKEKWNPIARAVSKIYFIFNAFNEPHFSMESLYVELIVVAKQSPVL